MNGTTIIQVVAMVISSFQWRFVSRAQDPNDATERISLNIQVQKTTSKTSQMDRTQCSLNGC